MIEVGEYYRTKKGLIRKVNTIHTPETRGVYYRKSKVLLVNGKHSLEDIVNHSKNIIDLIEVDDIVNGFKILEVHEPYPPFKEKILDIGYGIAIFKDSIKTILTKEQYEANCYKVKEK